MRLSALALNALILGSVAIGASPLFVRWSELGPLATGFHRVFWALPLLWVWLLRERRAAAAAGAAAGPRHRQLLLLAVPGLLFVGDLMFWHWSILRTSVANATLLANFSPVIVTLGAWLWLGEKIGGRFIAGLALALAGMALLVGQSVRLDVTHVRGDLYGLITACFFGSYMLAVARLRATVGPAALMFWSTLTTSIGLLIASLIAGENLWPATAGGLIVLLALAWVSHVGGQGLIAYALGHLPAAFSALVILIEPLTAAVLGWLLLSEPLGALQWLGALFLLAGIVVARR